jgi:AcrR family transcriptional regulator
VPDDASTRERLLDAAERLLAEHGSSATSVRDVLTAAGVANASAVGYYFGSKDGLVAAVERRAVEDVNAERAAGLEALGPEPSLEELVRAWVAPLVRLRCTGRGPSTARVFMRIFEEPQEQWASNGATEVMEVGWRYLEASARHLPGADRDELLWRWQSVTAVMAFYAHGYLEPFGEPSSPDDMERHLALLVPQGAALLRAGRGGDAGVRLGRRRR